MYAICMEKKRCVLNAIPPYGHLICHQRWRSTALFQSLKDGGVKTILDSDLSDVDFLLSNRTCILYVSEGDQVAGNSYRRKLVCFRNASSNLQAVVLVERTKLSEQYFSSLQRFVVLELGLVLLPVSSQPEASQLVGQMVHGDNRESPFRSRSTSRLSEPLVLALLQQVPGVGRVKASALLQQFPSMHQLCAATHLELEAIVGAAAARLIHNFFHNNV